jgi:hypothetical protein
VPIARHSRRMLRDQTEASINKLNSLAEFQVLASLGQDGNASNRGVVAMWEFERIAYVYVAIGASLALASLASNWSHSRRLKGLHFVVAHVFWPISFAITLVLALLEP